MYSNTHIFLQDYSAKLCIIQGQIKFDLQRETDVNNIFHHLVVMAILRAKSERIGFNSESRRRDACATLVLYFPLK